MFDGNSSKTAGGAIGSRPKSHGDNSLATLDIIDSTFQNNVAVTTGGAIDNSFMHSATLKDTANDAVYIASSTFTNNSAENGGAIYNHDVDYSGHTVAMNIEDSKFTDNIATANGGAVYNEGAMTFVGTNTFSGNTANGVKNDIYNTGTLMFADGSTTNFGGGIAGTSAVTIGSGATVNFNGATNTVAITNNGTMTATDTVFGDVTTKYEGSITNLNGDITAHSVVSQIQGVTNVNKDSATGTLNVAATVTGDGSAQWVMFQGVKATGVGGTRGGKINIGGENLNVNIKDSTTGDYVAIYGVHTGTNTLAYTEDTDQAHTVINATNTNVYITDTGDATGNATNNGRAFTVMSKGILDIDSNLTAKASSVLVTRGEARTNINVAETKTVKLDGDIEFNYDEATSGTKVDASVDLRLTDANSYWTGKTVKSGDGGTIPEGKADVTGMKLTLKNGANWNVTGDSFVNDLTVTNASVNKTGDTTQTVTISGTTGTGALNNASIATNVTNEGTMTATDTTFNGTVKVMSDGAATLVSKDKDIVANGRIWAYGTVTLSGEKGIFNDWTISSGTTGVMNLNANELNFSNIVWAQKGATININTDEAYKNAVTNINVTDDTALTAMTGATVSVGGKTLNISGTGEANGLWASTNVIEPDPEKRTHLTVNTDETIINIKDAEGNLSGAGLVTMSTGMMDINSNLTVNAKDAIVTRGQSVMNINTNGEHSTVLNGNINYDYEGNTSGSLVDATVNANMTGAASAWTGNSYVSWGNMEDGVHSSEMMKPDLLVVNALNVTLADGAKWTPTEIVASDVKQEDDGKWDGQRQTKVNTLTMNGTDAAGTIDFVAGTSENATAAIGTLTGTKGVINMTGVTGAKTVVDTFNITDLTVNGGTLESTTVTNNVADGKLTLNGTTVNASVENSKTLTATDTTFEKELTNNAGGTLSVTDSTLSEGLTSTGANAVATINNATLAAGKTYTATSGGKIVMESGTIATSADKTLASYFGTDHVAQRFVLDKAGMIDTTSDQIFKNALTTFSPVDPKKPTAAEKNAFVEANKNGSGEVKATQIDFQGGSVQINDDYYTLAYAATAKENLANASTLGTGKGLTSLVMMGNLITAEGVNVTTVDQIDDKNEPTPGAVMEYDKVTALTLNGSLLVGTNDVLTTEGAVEQIKGETGITIRDTSATSISVNKLNLAQQATGIIVTNEKTVTLGGSEGKEKEVDVVEVATEVIDVDVVVGVDKETADLLNIEQKGTLNIGNSQADANAQYALAGNVTVNNTETGEANSQSELNVEGQATISKNLTLSGAKVTIGAANEGSKLTVKGTTTVQAAGTEEAPVATTITGAIEGDALINNGTLKANADDLQFKTIENNSIHTLELTGGEIGADITSTSATGGAIKITGDVLVNGKTLTNQLTTVTDGAQLTFTGAKTTLNGTSKLTAVQGSTLAFDLDSYNVGDTIVETTNAADLSKLDKNSVKLLQEKQGQKFVKESDTITLISKAEGYDKIGTKENPNAVKVTSASSLLNYTYGVYQDAGALMAGYLGTGAAEETKSLLEGRLAGAGTLAQANDLIAGDVAQDLGNTAGKTGWQAFAAIKGMYGRYNTGNHLDLNSLQVAAGLAKQTGENTTLGLFIEGGNGRYTSYDTFTSGDLRADGDVNYFGAGIIARHAFSKTDKGNGYVDAAFGAGHTSQDYATENAGLGKARYDASSAYLKAHATIGYEKNLAQGKLNGYLKYLWTHQNGDNTALNGETLDLDAINSSRLRAGFRYTQTLRKTLAWYGGLAYEYEFDGKANGTISGYRINEADYKGGSGMAELGLKFAPETAKGWKFDAGLQGFTGKRDSIGVRLGAWYEF